MLGPARMPAGMDRRADQLQREFIEGVVATHIDSRTGSSLDPCKSLRAGDSEPHPPGQYRSMADYAQGFRIVSMVVQRWHDTVEFMEGDDPCHRPELDRADFCPGFIGWYPNAFFDVTMDALPGYLVSQAGFDGSAVSLARLDKYGVNRASSRFWAEYDGWYKRFNEEGPVGSGHVDLNRHFHQAS